MILDLYILCDVPRQSGGSTQIPSLTGYEPKLVEIKAIETQAIEPEDFEPRRIELDRNLGTDPYQLQGRLAKISFTEDVDEFGKVGAETSCLQSQMRSDYGSRESIADSELEDGEPRKKLASPQYFQSREDCESSRMPIAPGKPAALLQERGASAKRTQAESRKGLMPSSSQEPSATGKPAALFSLGSEEPGDQFKSSVFKHADPSDLRRSLLEGNKNDLLSQARSELMRQEHQVGSLNSCINERQQQAYAQRLELQDAHHGYIESRREQARLQEELTMKEKVLRDTLMRSMREMGEMKRAQGLQIRGDEDSVQK